MGKPVLPCALLIAVLAFPACAGAPAVTAPPQEGAPLELPMDPSAAEPPVVFEMPELMCVAPAEGIAFVPDYPIDIFYFEGVWFWKIRDTWYWSRTYMGMLYELEEGMVPGRLSAFARDYRTVLPDCEEYTYEEWERSFGPP